MDSIGNYREAAMIRTRKINRSVTIDTLPRNAADGISGETFLNNTGGTPDVAGAVPPFGVAYAAAEHNNAWSTLHAALKRMADNSYDFEFTGVGIGVNSVVRDDTGGWLVTTGGNPGDTVVLGPRALRRLSVGYSTSRMPRYDWALRLPDVATGFIIRLGFCESGAVDFGVDNNEFAFRVQDGINGGRWQLGVAAGGNLQPVRDSRVPFSPGAMVRLIADMNAQLVPKFYIGSNQFDGLEIRDPVWVDTVNAGQGTFEPMDPDTQLFPFLTIQQTGQTPVSIAVLDYDFGQFAELPVFGGGGPVN